MAEQGDDAPLGIGDPIDRLQSRLNHAVQVIGDLRGGKNLRIEGHIKNGGRIASLLQRKLKVRS